MRRIARFALLATLACTIHGLLAQTSDPWAAELQSPNAGRRAKAARRMGKSGDPAVIPALAAAINDPEEKVRREVVLALASLRVAESLDPLIAATRDASPKIRELAVDSLVGYYTGQGPSMGFGAFWKRAWRMTGGRFTEENVRVDPGVRVEPKVVSALVTALNDTRAIEASRKAADGLGILMARVAVLDLVKAAHSADKDLALVALNSLAKIKDLSAGPQLLDLLDSPDRDVKQEAAVTLGILRVQDALPRLQAMYENEPDRRAREKALEGLAYLGNEVSVPLFIKALWSSQDSFRISAAEGLGRAGDVQAIPELDRAVQTERDAEARLAMQLAITSLGKYDFLSALVEELSSRRRGDIAQAYLVELSRKSNFLPRLYPYMNSRHSDVRRRLCTVLMFTGNNTSIEHLERLSHDRDADVATEALRALRAVRIRAAAETSG